MQNPNPSKPSTSATQLRSGIENLEPNCWVISVFDLIGCYSSGRSEEEAVAQAGNRVRQYFEWLGKKDGNPAPFEESVQVLIAERVETYPWPKDPALPVHAFFEDDARPLRPWDLDMAGRLLDWSRQDFLRLSGALLPDSLSRLENAPNWKTLDDLFGHMWETENMILNRMGAMVDRPTCRATRSAGCRSSARGSGKSCRNGPKADIRVEEFGEKWSPRKALRRVLWHERDHIAQLEGLITHVP